MYRYKPPSYQTTMLNSLLSLWQGPHDRLLDIGAGTGAVAQCMADLFPVGSVTAIDVADRFCPGLTISTSVFDGQTLPFADNSFDAATLNNVVHHVPVAARTGLLREIRRVVKGPLYIKDHEIRNRSDHARLAVLDVLGNVPFGGMVRAHYLSMPQWRLLAAGAGFHISAQQMATYRRGAFGLAFPNRLEVVMRWNDA